MLSGVIGLFSLFSLLVVSSTFANRFKLWTIAKFFEVVDPRTMRMWIKLDTDPLISLVSDYSRTTGVLLTVLTFRSNGGGWFGGLSCVHDRFFLFRFFKLCPLSFS